MSPRNAVVAIPVDVQADLINYDQAQRGLERLTVAPAPWWDLPMRSAWVTDEPVPEIAAEHRAGV